MGNWWSEHPDLERVARHGRGELEHETATAEFETELLRKRRRSLIDVCFEWMSRGDLVTVSVVGSHFQGRLTAAVNDLLVVQTKTIEISVSLPQASHVRSDQRGTFEGTSGERSASSFRAQLGRCEIDGTPVRLVGREFDVTGIIDASTDDHALVRDSSGVEWALPRNGVGFAIRV